jgi:hypothetical protein
LYTPFVDGEFPARRGKRVGILRAEFLLASLVTPSYYLRHVSLTFVAHGGCPMSPKTHNAPMNFKTMSQPDVPQSRNGKHKQIVTKILSDLAQLPDGVALKVPFAELVESKEKVRSALNRATRKAGRNVATATDATFLYVWNTK